MTTDNMLLINDLMTYRENAGNVANLREWLTSEKDEATRQSYQDDLNVISAHNATIVTKYAAMGLNISYDPEAHQVSLSPNICPTCDEVVGLEDDHSHN